MSASSWLGDSSEVSAPLQRDEVSAEFEDHVGFEQDANFDIPMESVKRQVSRCDQSHLVVSQHDLRVKAGEVVATLWPREETSAI